VTSARLTQGKWYERPPEGGPVVGSTEASGGGLIAAVEADSPAARAGLQAGQRLLSAQGETLRDSIDWLWVSDGAQVDVVARDAQGSERALTLRRDQGESWGLEFADPLFDGIKTCCNDCAFCFMKQLPEGLRPSLYVRDDDYRLSFLQGNFVTLTNIDDGEVARIIEQHLSPLHVSLHAVDPQVRRRLMGHNQERGLVVLDRLLEAGIDVHIQIVLVPGVNDGDVLDQTLLYLADPARKPRVASVGIVPVAWTKYVKDTALSARGTGSDTPLPNWRDALDCARVIEQVQRYQFAEEKAQDCDWVYLADEFYITAQAPFPLAKYYDGFPQYENGIGMVWGLIEDFKEHLARIQQALSLVPEQSEALTLVCGELIRDTLIGALGAVGAGGKVRLLPVRNEFLGGTVSVTALLSASDIIRAISYDFERTSLPTTYLIPEVIFNSVGLTLDGRMIDEIVLRLPAPALFFPATATGLADAIIEAVRAE